MTFVYTRLGGATTTGLPDELDCGWLQDRRGQRRPYRRAWVANAGRAGDMWREMAFAAPAPERRTVPRAGLETYILQQEPSGQWFVDMWGSNVAGAIRPPHSAAPAAASGRNLDDTCYIIELDHATHT